MSGGSAYRQHTPVAQRVAVLCNGLENRCVAYQRDPLSVRFDGKARAWVARAYAVKGQWAGEFVPPPGPRGRAWMAAHGIFRAYERDRWGEVRWLRAYKRSVFHTVNWYGGVSGLRGERNTGAGSGGWHAPVRVEWQTGIRAGAGPHEGMWAVRIRIHPGGRATSRIGLAKAIRENDNWIDEEGQPTFRQSTPEDRPWEPAG